MKYNTNTPVHILDKYVNHIDHRWAQLNELNLTLVSEGIKYLFLINSGGCVAVLTFIGTSELALKAQWPWIILSFFFGGLILVGLLNFARYHAIDWIQTNYVSDTSEFYNGNLDYDDLYSKDAIRVKKVWWIPIFAYAAFACFIAGGVIGFANYQEFITKEKKVTRNIAIDQKNHVPILPKVPPQPQPPKP